MVVGTPEAAIAANGLYHVPTEPTEYFQIRKIQRDTFEDDYPGGMSVLQVFIPASVMDRHAKGFDWYNASSHSLSMMHHQRILAILGFLPNFPGEDISWEVGPDGKNVKKVTPVHFKTDTVYIWVPREDNPKEWAGCFLRVMFRADDQKYVLASLQKLFDARQSTQEKILNVYAKERSKIKNAKRMVHETIGYYEWAETCMFFSPPEKTKNWGRHVDRVESLYNDLNPFNVFDVTNSLKMACGAGADPQYCDIDNYYDGAVYTRFPENGKHVYLIPSYQINPSCINKFYLPHQEKPSYMVSQEEEEYVKMWGESSRATFRFLNRSANLSQPNDIETVKKFVNNKMTECYEKYGHSLRLYNKEKTKIKKEALGILEKFVLTPHGDVGDAVKAMAEWADEYLRGRRKKGLVPNFSLPTKKQSVNLSRWADVWIMYSTALDVIHGVYTVHEEIVSCLYACWNVYLRENKKNVLLTGPAQAGKSYTVLLLERQALIPGTSRPVAYMSDKALFVPGNKFDMSVEIHEEVVDSAIGVSGPGQKGSDDKVSLMKKRLNSTEMNCSTRVQTDKGWISQEIKSIANVVCLFCSNAKPGQIPHPIMTRVNHIPYRFRPREDMEDMLTIFNRNINAARRSDLKKFSTRNYRDQFLIMLVSVACYCGIFSESVDMFVAHTIFYQTLREGQKEGLTNTGCARSFERLMGDAKTMAIHEAIHLVFDSELSPIVDKPFEWEQLLLLEQHLITRVEHATMALGFGEHQWENSLQTEILIALKKKHFHTPADKNSTVYVTDTYRTAEDSKHEFEVAVRLNRDEEDDGKREEEHDDKKFKEKKYRPMLSHTELIYNRAKSLASSILPLMTVKPELAELQSELVRMSRVKLDVATKINGKYTIEQIPMITMTPTHLRVAKRVIQNCAHGILKRCIQKVMSYKGVRPQNVLYGKTMPGLPYIWQTLVIKERPNATPLKCHKPGHHDVIMQRLTSELLKSVDQDGNGNGKINFFEDETGADHMDLDMDIEQFAMENHLHKIGFLPEDRTKLPTPVAWHMDERIRAMYDSSELLKYPECFERMNPKEYEEKRKKHKTDNPHLYSAKSIIDRVREKNAAWASAPAEPVVVSASGAQGRKRRMVDQPEEEESDAEYEIDVQTFSKVDDQAHDEYLKQKAADDAEFTARFMSEYDNVLGSTSLLSEEARQRFQEIDDCVQAAELDQDFKLDVQQQAASMFEVGMSTWGAAD